MKEATAPFANRSAVFALLFSFSFSSFMNAWLLLRGAGAKERERGGLLFCFAFLHNTFNLLRMIITTHRERERDSDWKRKQIDLKRMKVSQCGCNFHDELSWFQFRSF